MAAEITRHYPDADIELIKGGGGDFIVIAYRGDGGPTELWNKNASGRGFPEPQEVLRGLG